MVARVKTVPRVITARSLEIMVITAISLIGAARISVMKNSQT